ncbi:type VII secretion integral membrane protein EccD [Mycolicibacterium litorale]|uniref:type VII secretion integral membrane protein EccD n=1 Tax=Mycolicibacterium litorale TaxID=758802 RepID=UPI003CF56BC7
MSANVCHVSVHADDGVDAVDLVLPTALPVASLMPDIVELVVSGDTGTAAHWQLATVCGTVLDESVALREQGIGDGDLLLLSPAKPPVPAFGRTDPVTAVLTAAPPATDGCALRAVAGLVVAAAGIAGCLAGRGAMTASLITAGTVLAVASGAAVASSRSDRGAWVSGPLGCLIVLMAALCGALAVPGPFGAPHALLAAATASAAALILLRVGVGDPIASTAAASAGLLCAAAISVAVLWNPPGDAVGVVMALSGLGALSLAPRLTVVASGLGPPPSPDDEPFLDVDRRASTGHRILVGLVVGACATAGLGAAIVAAACLRGSGPWLPDAAFCAVVGSALLLRARCYAAGRCRWALIVSGTCSLTGLLAIVVAQYGHWAAAAAVCAGVIAIVHDAPAESSPVASRALEVFEYAVLAAVVPAACAALDVFSLVRTASLL